MGWLIFIILAAIIVFMTINNDSLKNKIRTKDGNPKIDLTVIQCENIPEGVEVVISCTQDELIINSNGYERKIPHEDIIDITVEPANQIINNPQFSFGKAVVGTAIFGGVGAIAGLSGKKELKMMVLSYIKDEEIDYMVFLQKTVGGKSLKAEAFILDNVYKDMVKMIKAK